MRISGISGLVSAFFLAVVLPVALIFVYHFWKEKGLRGISQRKKHRMRKLMRRWIGVAIFAVIGGLIGAAGYYFAPATIMIQPPPRPYVIIRDTTLEPLEADKPPNISFVLENSGSVEVEGKLEALSSHLSYFADTKLLEYGKAKGSTFKLAPKQTTNMTAKIETVKPTADDIKQLNEHTEELFFFTKGEYWSQDGRRFPINYCRKYEPSLPAKNVICDDDVKAVDPGS